MEKSNIIAALKERMDNIEKWQEEISKKKGSKKQKVDEEVCPECGGDLLFVEEGVVHCPKCDQYFEVEVEKE